MNDERFITLDSVTQFLKFYFLRIKEKLIVVHGRFMRGSSSYCSVGKMGKGHSYNLSILQE